MRKSAAAARRCRPIVVRLRRSVEAGEQHGADDHRDDRDPADPQRADRDRGVQPAERADRLPARAEREQIDVLEQEADREARDEHRRRRGAAQRPERDPLHARASTAITTAKQARIATIAGWPLR